MDNFIPAVGQGAIAIETRQNDTETIDIIKVLNYEIDAKCVLAERAFLREIDGGCEIPIGAYCRLKDNKIMIDGFIGDEKSLKIYRETLYGNIDNCEKLGTELARKLKLVVKFK